MKAPKVLVLSGDGVNCERETARAFELSGAQAQIVHVNDLLAKKAHLLDFQMLAFPGGFSFGDELGSGRVLGLKIKSYLQNDLKEFLARKRPIIGICNGFQVLTKLGLLPEPFSERSFALAPNESGHFLNRWVSLRIEKDSPCIWTRLLSEKGITQVDLPARHGEGRVSFLKGQEEVLFQKLKNKGQLPLFYTENINGSYNEIAGVCDPSGLVLGLMPHPEAHVSSSLHPVLSQTERRGEEGPGLYFFKSAVAHVQES